jgi:hypothetical protein
MIYNISEEFDQNYGHSVMQHFLCQEQIKSCAGRLKQQIDDSGHWRETHGLCCVLSSCIL